MKIFDLIGGRIVLLCLEDEDLDEEALAMKAMGLPTSFTSSLVIEYFLNKPKFVFS